MQRELITFQVAEQLFGLDVMAIREIRAWSPVTRLPQVPHYVSGVINLRGTVMPVYDLAARLGWSATEPTPRHPVIITEFEGKLRGFVVDGVNDIVSVSMDSQQCPDTVEHNKIAQFIQGLTPLNDDMVIILNLGAVVGDDAIMEVAA